jgi:hypothetical protein
MEVNAIDPAIPSQTCERQFPINFPSANVGLLKFWLAEEIL